MGAFETSPGAHPAPGSNVKGAVGGANWCFLLPSLELGRVVCLGVPSPAALATLGRLAEEVAVCAPERQLRRIRSAIASSRPANVSMLESDRLGASPLPDGCADLVLLARAPRLSFARGRRLERETERLLARDGLAYREIRSVPGWLDGGAAGHGTGPGESAARLWLAPASGEMRAAAPLGDPQAIAFLESFVGRPLFRRQLLRRPGRILSRHRTVRRAVRREGALAGRGAGSLTAGPPQYLRSLAAAAGVDIDDRRWALVAPGDYPSQKVLFFLFAPAAAVPDSVVKITRDPRLNPRLDNEWRALTLLHERGLGSDGTLPTPLFFGVHRELAVLGESAIDGEPFRKRTHATAECPHARSAVEWLLDLGTATASKGRTDARSISGLGQLYEQFKRLYDLEAGEEDFLSAQISALTHGADGLPLVFQHGDPGPWNVLITKDGRTAFLDWEAAEPQGMPLWDLFHFLRSYSFTISRAAGTRDALGSFSEQWLEASAFSRLLAETTSRFCARTGLAPGLVEPLFYVCWMHRALKEAATLPPRRLQGGRFINLLRLAVERRDSPGLRRLFSIARD
ncbi:MAG: phosphotransferase [Gaiellaceae bacterium]